MMTPKCGLSVLDGGNRRVIQAVLALRGPRVVTIEVFLFLIIQGADRCLEKVLLLRSYG